MLLNLRFNIFLDFDSVLNVLVKELEDVVTDSAVYERVKNGFQVLIFGPPNIGKSSLMNFLGNNLTYLNSLI